MKKVEKTISRIIHREKNKLRLDFIKCAMSEKVKLAEEWKKLHDVDYAIDCILKELESD